MSANSTDFFFFGGDDRGLLVSEGRIGYLIKSDYGMICGEWEVIDVVTALSAYRRERERAFEIAERRQQRGAAEVLGCHWRGEVR